MAFVDIGVSTEIPQILYNELERMVGAEYATRCDSNKDAFPRFQSSANEPNVAARLELSIDALLSFPLTGIMRLRNAFKSLEVVNMVEYVYPQQDLSM